MATVRHGIYLEQHPPARRQYLTGRPRGVRPVIVAHTAESGTALAILDPKAENVASFIQGRADAGSYHLIGDADSIIQLVRFADRASHDATGSNHWSIGIALAMNAADWPALIDAGPGDGRAAALVDTFGQMAAMAARWLVSHGQPAPEARLLTRAESELPDASGFISHARRDPTRRSDPGLHFPWPAALAAYRRHLDHPPPPAPTPGAPTMERNQLVEQLQLSLIERGLTDIDPDNTEQVRRYADGIFGPVTMADVINGLDLTADESPDLSYLADLEAAYSATIDRAEAAEARATASTARADAAETDADLWRRYSEATRALTYLNNVAATR